jgi:hypothetical protein
MKMTRRKAGGLILGAPLIASAAGAALLSQRPAGAQETPPPEPEPSPLGKFLARQSDDLDADMKKKLRKDVTQLEEALKVLRDFPIGNDVPPAGSFRAMRSKPGGRS